MKTLFVPAIRLLDRMNYPFKFMLIMFVCFATALALLAQVYISLRQNMDVAEREIAGLTLFDAGFDVVLLTQQHRGLSAGVLGGSTEMVPQREAKAGELQAALSKLDAAIGADPLWRPLQPPWAPIRGELDRLARSATQLGGPESFRAHTEVIARLLHWLGDVGDASGLALDPDAASANLVTPLLTSLPELSERLGQLRARGTNIVARHELTRSDEHGVVALLAEIGRSEADLLERLGRAGKANAGLAGGLERMRSEITTAVSGVRTAVMRDIVDQQFTLSAPAYFALVTEAINVAVRNFNEVLRPQTGKLLHERLDRLAGQLQLQIVLSVVAMLVAGYLFIGVYLAILRSVRELSTGAQRFAAGDYRERVEFSARDELAEVAQQFNKMADEVAVLIREIQQGASQLGSSASELSGSARRVSDGSEAQSESASGVAVAVEEMTVSVQEISRHAATAQEMAETSGRLSEEGGAVMRRSVEEMERIADAVDRSGEAISELGEKSRQITTIVDSIRDIADQTNLLALNAAIEAARAGETGRGFAVVADEVRKLAERTSLATQEIAGMVQAIQQGTERAVETMQQGVQRVRDGVALSNQAGESIAQIHGGAQQVLGAVREITVALNEQSLASNEIAQNVERIAAMAGDNSVAAHQTTSTAEVLENLAATLRQQVGRFQV
ncbi:methyl-accepting chemotaxis protein [Thauera sp. SDU_THAU2]|uniref:methyl-accepting chemotaxis protein n=1 Tax=Thauera sp. SDU_THAU2 TaxID=3136633 RepID=UPI0031203249